MGEVECGWDAVVSSGGEEREGAKVIDKQMFAMMFVLLSSRPGCPVGITG